MYQVTKKNMFQPTQYQWIGSGANYRTVPLFAMADFSRILHANVIRFLIDCNDDNPSQLDSLTRTDDFYDEIWNISLNISCAAILYNDVKPYATTTRIGVLGGPPSSWLGKDQELFGNALLSYAYFVVSGILVYASYGMFFDYIEVIDDPSSSSTTYITPSNYTVLLNIVRQLFSRRITGLTGIYTQLQNIKWMGPSANIQNLRDYVSIVDVNLIDAWSLRVEEPMEDYQSFQGSGIEKRHYIESQLNNLVEWMRFHKRVPIFITRLSTNSTQYDSLINYGPSYFESNEHAIRIADLIIVAMKQGIQSICSWEVHNPLNDFKTLIRKDNSTRPIFELYSFFNRIINGIIYLDISLPTVALIKSEDSISIIIPRAQMFADERTFSYEIQDINWNTTSQCTMSLSIFPTTIKSTKNIQTNYIFNDNGILTLTFTNVPYLCVLFVRCDVYTF